MADEENEAIEWLKRLVKINKRDNLDDTFAEILLNLIEKQSKEIEELRNEVMEKELIIDGMKEDRRIAAEEIQEQYFVSKEEAEQKEKKAYIDGTNIADELCNKKWEDKIKAKTIEIKNRQVKDEFITASQGKLNTIIDMESLLEKE